MALSIRTLRSGGWLSKVAAAHTTPSAAFSASAGPPQQVSPNVQFHASPKGLPSEQRPLVLLYSWLVAKAKHMHKFGDFYLREGADVLHIKLSPTELLRPHKAHAVVRSVLDFAGAESAPTQPILAHGFSVGCYLYAETLVQILNEPQYRAVGDRLRGQVLDSPVDYQGVPFGVANALTTQPLLRKAIERSLNRYLEARRHGVTRHYARASSTISENALLTPTLLFYSHGDVVADVSRNERAIQGWQERGIHVEAKCFKDSAHVGHYLKYPTEYIDTLASFMKYVLSRSEQQEDEKIQQRIRQKLTDRVAVK